MPVDYTVNSNETDLSNLTDSFTGKFRENFRTGQKVFEIIYNRVYDGNEIWGSQVWVFGDGPDSFGHQDHCVKTPSDRTIRPGSENYYNFFQKEELNTLRDSMDEKINSMKEEIMLQLQEKIDQALSEIDDNTDRSDQIDSVKSNIQGTICGTRSLIATR